MRSCLFVPLKTAISPIHNGWYFHTHAVARRRLFIVFFHEVSPACRLRCSTLALPSTTSHGFRGLPGPSQRHGCDAERRTDDDAAAAEKNDAVDE